MFIISVSISTSHLWLGQLKDSLPDYRLWLRVGQLDFDFASVSVDFDFASVSVDFDFASVSVDFDFASVFLDFDRDLVLQGGSFREDWWVVFGFRDGMYQFWYLTKENFLFLSCKFRDKYDKQADLFITRRAHTEVIPIFFLLRQSWALI
jgi:hypothetical protein